LNAGWRTEQKVVDVEGDVTVFTSTGECTDKFNATRGDEHAKLVVTCKKLEPAVSAVMDPAGIS